jgi:hypothetical protein
VPSTPINEQKSTMVFNTAFQKKFPFVTFLDIYICIFIEFHFHILVAISCKVYNILISCTSLYAAKSDEMRGTV